MSHTTAFAPSASKAATVARPMPAAPPVTTTILSLRFSSKLEHPPHTQLEFARRKCRDEFSEVRVLHRRQRRVRGRRSAEELALVRDDRLHVIVGHVRQIKHLGDRFNLSDPEVESSRESQRKLAE